MSDKLQFVVMWAKRTSVDDQQTEVYSTLTKSLQTVLITKSGAKYENLSQTL